METTTTHIRYIIYARKSEESEDRQVQSIDDQLSRLNIVAAQRNATILDTMTEARSAKTPGDRPVFDALLSRIEAGEADGIICWQINRLSRNPIDSGRIGWLLQRSIIRSILTPEREYRPEDNVLLLSVETGMANQYILDLSRNVKRGIQGKLDRGELPGRAPAGYLNDRLTKTVIKDPERFIAIRRAWDLILTGEYSVSAALRKLNGDWGFRMPVRARTGGKPLALSSFHRIVANPFYMGAIHVNGKDYLGNHEPMVTPREFRTVQEIIHRNDKPRPSRHRFTYSRLFRCGECGCLITAEHRTKRLRHSGLVRHYTYYHCTLRGKRAPCSQNKYISEDLLTDRIARELARVAIWPALRDFAVRQLKIQLTAKQAAQTPDAPNDRRVILTRQLDRLLDLCVRGVISESDYSSRRRELQTELAQCRHEKDSASRGKARMERLVLAFDGLVDLDRRFRDATMDARRELLTRIGLNRTVFNGTPAISVWEWLLPIKEFVTGLPLQSGRFEPTGSAMNTTQKGAFAPYVPIWSSLVDEVDNRFPSAEEYDRLMAESKKQAHSKAFDLPGEDLWKAA